MLGVLMPCGGGDPIPLLQPRLLIGRRSRCDITLRFPNVSSHHCELEHVEGFWRVRDLQSRNGTRVNGEKCHNSRCLMPGDILSFAKHRFEISYSPPANTPPPEEQDPFAIGLLEKAGLAQHDADHNMSFPQSQKIDPNPPPKKYNLEDELAKDWRSQGESKP